MKCKRCGRKLTSKISQERGYGPVCFRIVSLAKKEEKAESSELQFLKMEINMLKRQMGELKNGIRTIKPIERLKREKTITSSKEKIGMISVMKEMKKLFNETNGDFRAILTPIEPNSQIIESPSIYI